jgi:GntR family transcriptional regulator/MocR family aminotransferase
LFSAGTKLALYWLCKKSHFYYFNGTIMPKTTTHISLPFLSLNRSVTVPLYRQLYEAIRNSILEGMLQHGERMPATRALAEELQVSRNCVLLAFEQLVLEGYLEGKTGSGTFVCAQLPVQPRRKKPGTAGRSAAVPRRSRLAPVQYPVPEARLLKDSGYESPLPFQVAVPAYDLFPFRVWSRIAAQVYRDIHRLHLGYDDAQGYYPLREALCNYLRIHRSIHCTPAQVVMTSGSRQALHLACSLLLQQGDGCWMEDPGYNAVKLSITRHGGQLCPVPVTPQGIDVDYAITHYPHARLAYLTPSHQFPLGGTLPLTERLKLLKHAAKHNMWILEDDYDSEFRYNGRPIPALQSLDSAGNVVYIGTFSKVLFPALRMGYLVLPSKQMATQFRLAKAAIDRQSPLIDQAILAAFINQGHFARHLRRMRMLYKKMHDELVTLLQLHLADELDVQAGDAGMHLVAWLKQYRDASALVEKAAAQGLVLHTVEDYVIRFRQRPGLQMGFTGFSAAQLKHAVLALKKLLKQR